MLLGRALNVLGAVLCELFSDDLADGFHVSHETKKYDNMTILLFRSLMGLVTLCR